MIFLWNMFDVWICWAPRTFKPRSCLFPTMKNARVTPQYILGMSWPQLLILKAFYSIKFCWFLLGRHPNECRVTNSTSMFLSTCELRTLKTWIQLPSWYITSLSLHSQAGRFYLPASRSEHQNSLVESVLPLSPGKTPDTKALTLKSSVFLALF